MADAIVKAMPVQQPAKSAGFEMTPEQEKMIRDTFLSGAPPAEAKILLEVAKARRLNPFTRQVHFVKRWDNSKRCEVWAVQVGIDGFRSIAERTGLYDGQDEPEFEYAKDGSLRLCRVRVYRKDWSRPAVGVAHWDEYVQTTKDAKTDERRPNAMWARGKHFMLAKCAEAAAMRKAFPEDMSGLYAPEEMAGDEREVEPRKSAKELARAKVAALEKPAANEEQAPPHDVVTGEVVEDGPPDEQPAAPAVVPFGKHQGKPVAELSDAQLEWYLDRAREKAMKGDSRDAGWMAVLEAEVARRGDG